MEIGSRGFYESNEGNVLAEDIPSDSTSCASSSDSDDDYEPEVPNMDTEELSAPSEPETETETSVPQAIPERKRLLKKDYRIELNDFIESLVLHSTLQLEQETPAPLMCSCSLVRMT